MRASHCHKSPAHASTRPLLRRGRRLATVLGHRNRHHTQHTHTRTHAHAHEAARRQGTAHRGWQHSLGGAAASVRRGRRQQLPRRRRQPRAGNRHHTQHTHSGVAHTRRGCHVRTKRGRVSAKFSNMTASHHPFPSPRGRAACPSTPTSTVSLASLLDSPDVDSTPPRHAHTHSRTRAERHTHTRAATYHAVVANVNMQRACQVPYDRRPLGDVGDVGNEGSGADATV
jgi:hypothetical protein